MHILCRSCHRKTPFGLSQAIERHLPPGKQCRPVGFRFADFSAPDPSGLVRPHGGCFAVLSALIRSFPIDSPLRAELSFSLPKPFPRPCVRQSLICYGSLPRPICTRLLPQGSPFGSTFGGYNSTFPWSRLYSLAPARLALRAHLRWLQLDLLKVSFLRLGSPIHCH
jgi:hypothetical protein